jgi:hypothetical protein
MAAHAQTIKNIELFGGFSVSKPLGIPSDISFQSGNGIMLGINYNKNLGKNNYLFIDLTGIYRLYNIEGYFAANDQFLITSPTTKTNTLILSPVALGIGYQRSTDSKLLFGSSIQLNYIGTITRSYKEAANETRETYTMQKKMHPALMAFIGFLPASKKGVHIDLVTDYYFVSMANNVSFHPVSIAIRFTGGL